MNLIRQATKIVMFLNYGLSITKRRSSEQVEITCSNSRFSTNYMFSGKCVTYGRGVDLINLSQRILPVLKLF